MITSVVWGLRFSWQAIICEGKDAFTLFVLAWNRSDLYYPGDTVVKNLPTNAVDTRVAGSIPGSGRSGVGNGNWF